MQPVAYLRKSRVVNDREMSWEVQEQKVRELAAGHGDAERLTILSDWNRSGTKGVNGRPGYAALVASVDAGEVSALYSYSLSRLGRSLPELRRVIDLCVAKGVPVRFADGEPREVTSTWGKFVLNILGSVAELEADIASDRAKDTVAARRARGDRIGHPFYGERPGEDPAAIVSAYREARSVVGAGRLLNARGIPTRSGRPWSSTSVREQLVRLGAMPKRSRPGVKAAAPFVLYRLLQCHCGRVLTGSRSVNGSDPNYTVYRCIGGRTLADHGKRSVPEKAILAAVQAEASLLQVPFSTVEMAASSADQRAALEAKRSRVVDMYVEGVIDKSERDRRLVDVDDALEALDAAQAVVKVPPAIDWSWTPETINAVLRALWERVELGPDLMPARFVWRISEWRATD